MRWGTLVLSLLATGCATRATGPAPLVREERLKTGMGYRISLPPAVLAQRPRIAVWLHPERSAGVDLIEPLAPLLARHGFALVVPTDKDFRGWTSHDVEELFGAVLPAAAQKHGLVADQPLLIGFSAGAQIALHLWHGAPERWAGLVLVGGAPQLTSLEKVEDISFPASEAWRYGGTPVMSIVGERDPSSGKWRSVLEKWKAVGVPLDFKQVPNVDHQWCVGAFERERLDGWLSSLRSALAH
jgi:predicted esterase